ncbi:CRTAC1 family protein [Stieleria maiorica]|uniref:CRTAC1 family protein n=1 Tax=Stieleria maiorica TaxID=2795974 RepID=UPI00142F2B0C|nr:CRTAC1 family protein [Stieleria maiorica]
MNAPPTNRPTNRTTIQASLRRQLAVVFAAVATSISLTFSGCSCSRDAADNGNGTTPPLRSESEANLVKITQALAATENMEPDQAEQLWAELRTQFAQDPSVALNRALNAVLAVDMLTAAATDSVKTSEEKSAARALLPDAIEAARKAIDQYQENSGDAVTKLWLDSRIDAHEATLLGATLSKSLRRDLFTRLTQAIDGPMGEDPRAVILGGPLIELLEKMSDPIDGLPDAVLKPAAKSLQRLSDQNEDNLFLALRALRLAIDDQDAAAAELADRTWRLAKAVEPTLAAYTKPIGLSPEDLVDRIRDAVGAGDWAKADQSSVLWSNVLNPLEIVRTDRRRTSPHPLDRLNFDTVRELSSEIATAKPITGDTSGISFAFETITDGAMVLPLDADLDLRIDLATVSSDGQLQLFLRQDDTWESVADLKLDAVPSGLAAADLFMVDSSDSDRIKRSQPADQDDDAEEGTARDEVSPKRHDTLPTLIAYGPQGVQLVQVDMRNETPRAERLTSVEKATGLEELPAIAAVTMGDLEGDGDLDLILAPVDGQIRVMINRGNRTFFEAAIGTSTVDDDDPIADLTIADLDRDIDLDVLAIHESGRVSMLENLLHLQFRFRNLDAVPPLPVAADDPSLSIAVEDVDANVGWDVVATSSKQSSIAFGNSSDIGVWTVDRVETGPGFQSRPALSDFDNDSYLELIGTGQTLKLGPWGINVMDPAAELPEGLIDAKAVDVDSDGRIDLVSLGADGVGVGINQSTGDAHQLSVRFKGIADNAAASGRVNHYAIGSVLELRFGPHYRSRIVRGPATHFGMDGIDSADSIRVIMPNGLTQTIRDPEVDSIIEEEQTLKGSCPYLYSWDGQRFAFVTDCLWAAPLGLQVAAGVVQADRPWEYLKIDGDHVRQNKDGQYELRLTEELWEVAYVDKIALTAVDHPADVAVYSNEKVGPPSVATPTIFAFDENELHPVAAAVDTQARDVTELLTKADEHYVQGFDRRIRQGLCPPHWIDLDFGQAVKQSLADHDDASIHLVLRGWILPTDTSLNIQIDQNPELPSIEFPSVWVPDASAESGWQLVIPFMGFPGGKTKTIVVDVSEHIRHDDPRIRVRTSAQIYWDAASLAIQSAPASSVTQAVELIDAEVAFHGFSERIKADHTRPETYDYSQADAQPKWPPLRGSVSRYGDCTEQLRQWDDSMVVISGGDEIRMRFAPPEQDVPEGWKRDFILHCVGWDKDADLNTLTGQSIGPLPIRDMRGYPPTAQSAEQFEAVEQKNADSLRRRQSFRAFWNRGQRLEKPFLSTVNDSVIAW